MQVRMNVRYEDWIEIQDVLAGAVLLFSLKKIKRENVVKWKRDEKLEFKFEIENFFAEFLSQNI